MKARNAGLVRIYAGTDTGIIAGRPSVGLGWATSPASSHGRSSGGTADTLLQLPFYHPTCEEGLKPALRAICEAVKSPNLGELDDVAPEGL